MPYRRSHQQEGAEEGDGAILCIVTLAYDDHFSGLPGQTQMDLLGIVSASLVIGLRGGKVGDQERAAGEQRHSAGQILCTHLTQRQRQQREVAVGTSAAPGKEGRAPAKARTARVSRSK